MEITVLGTRGEIEPSAPYHSKQSGVLINDELLLDIGDEVFLDHNPRFILITHLHPDHAFFMRDKSQADIDAPVYAPEQCQQVVVNVLNKPIELDGYQVTPIPTIHSLKVKSQAYFIEHKDKRILYTGDMVWIEKKYHKKLQDLDLVITEASFVREGGMVRRNPDGKIYGHTGVPNLIRLFKRFTDHILLVHFGSWFYYNMQQSRKDIQALAKKYSIDITVGYDGLELEM